MNILIIKLGATGDVVRTTPLLRQFQGQIFWVTEAKNMILIERLSDDLQAISWDLRESILARHFDIVINLEDSPEVGGYLNTCNYDYLFGAYANPEGGLRYTDGSKPWFDLSLISTEGKLKADKLKFGNRKTYQELVFEGLGFQFKGEKYRLPEPIETGLSGDVAIATEAGHVWPMKKWAYYTELKERLENEGLSVNVLPKRSSLLEHLSDVRNHRCLVSGDSLPMHFALGTGTRCVTLFNCTSPWEIHDYGIQTKLVSPLLEEFFYKRGFDERAVTAISLEEVFTAVMSQLEAAASAVSRISS